MKQLLILAAAFLTLSASAQTREADALKSKLEKNEVATIDAKKGILARTWIDRANIKMDMTTIFTKDLISGIPAEQLVSDMMAGKPSGGMADVTLDGIEMTKYVYDNFDVYSDTEGIVRFWSVTTVVYPNALASAYGDLVKAKEFGAKDFTGSGRGVEAVNRLSNELATTAYSENLLGRKAESAKLFELSGDSKALIGVMDTASYFNAGVVYFQGEMYDKALPLFEKAFAHNYMPDGTLYYYIATCQDKLGDSAKAIQTAETGFNKYPQNPNIITTLINLYIASKQEPSKLISLIKDAQKLDPSNASLYLVEGDIYVKLGDFPNATVAIEKALAIDSKNFNICYSYGMMMILESDALAKEIQNLPLSDKDGYDKLMSRINSLRVNAVGQFEKAYELNKTNTDLVELLAQVSYIVRDQNSDMKAVYEKFSALSKASAQ